MDNNADRREEIQKLLALGRMDMEAGYPQYARQYFEKVLVLDASNQEAIEGLEQVDKALEVEAYLKSLETQAEETPAKLASGGRSIIGWIRKEREERARIVAERKRLAAEKREALEEEEMKEVDLSEDEHPQSLPTDRTELLQFQCQQLVNIELELKTQRGIMDKHTDLLKSISTVALFVMALILIGLGLSMCSGFLRTF
jgi:small-conductance mechanosensitive channel